MSITFKPRKSTRRIIIHDSHTTPDVKRATDILRWQGMKMGLLDIGYHFVIERDGHVVKTRDPDVIGTHTPGCNLDSVGICLVGGRTWVPKDQWGNVYDEVEPLDNFTQDQRIGLFETIMLLKRRYEGVSVWGHSEIQRYKDPSKPACPCLDMEELRADLLTYQLTGGLIA